MQPENQWNSEDSRTTLLREEGESMKRKIRSVWAGFVEFALRDNVLEVAVGLIIATAFTGVVNSLVTDVILPPISLLPFMSRNLEEKFLVLRKGPHYLKPHGYNTRQQAVDDGAVVLTYGVFIDQFVNFIGIGLVLYTIANVYGYFSRDSIIRHTVKCTYCRKEISSKAKRCPMCTSWLDGREDVETSALPLSRPGQA
ncbi:Anditomin synthesis protein L [Psilocybe cubensis]|uniref:Anditomin synthesis protein L n=2 Tax=Psilocybe cubensis TaxID=181762 RepID=A0ACB8HCQ1_PSICU|nr:Anditomin synthesis protein L [Psilocybe cubensis]KAH9485656.1 Anditomin synthesis protein L [Psilocybe cubensis]